MNEVEIDEEYDGSRNVYIEPEERALIRTKDVYQTNLDNGVSGYSKTLLAIVANFTNGGKPEGYNVQAMVGRSKRGEVALRMFAVVDDSTADPVFVKAGFQVRGCVAMVGCASVACSMIEGRTFSQALRITKDDIERAVDGLTPDRRYTAMFAAECIKALVGDWMYRAGMSLSAMDEYLGCDEGSVTCLLCEHCSLRAARTDMRIDNMLGVDASEDAEDADAAESAGSANVAESAEAGVAAATGAVAATEPKSEPAPQTSEELSPEEQEHARQEQNALAAVFDAVRAASGKSELATRETWEAAGLVPEHLSADEFAQLVFSYLEQWQQEHAEELQQEEEERAKRRSSCRSASRAVGVPPKIPNRRLAQIEADVAQAKAAGAKNAADAAGDSVAEAQAGAVTGDDAAAQDVTTQQEQADAPNAPAKAEQPDTDVDDDPWAGLNIPEGYKLEEIDGEIVLVQDPDVASKPRTIDCAHIAVMEGAAAKYLYDASAMTKSYAHWAFLAKEDNPVVTFAECVREDSRVYPRPYRADNLKNPPFNMSAQDIEETWEAVSTLESYADIQRTSASNGDVYFFSTKHLSPAHAHALAEYASVDRKRNV